MPDARPMGIFRKAAASVGLLLMVAGIAGLAYPFVGEFITSRQHAKAVADYKGDTLEIPEDRSESLIQAAMEFNGKILRRGEVAALTREEQEEYRSLLDVSGIGVMGYIDIPKIGITLPVYHGTEEEVLQAGIGHLEGSSLPVGGDGTHVVLAGHSGLPSSKLFTDLDQLEEGDQFTVTAVGHTVTYEVGWTEVLKPDEISFPIEEGQDLCTLMTCVPVGINSHRLLVHAHRVPNAEAETDEQGQDGIAQTMAGKIIPYLPAAVPVMALAAAAFLYVRKRSRRRHMGSNGKDR